MLAVQGQNPLNPQCPSLMQKAEPTNDLFPFTQVLGGLVKSHGERKLSTPAPRQSVPSTLQASLLFEASNGMSSAGLIIATHGQRRCQGLELLHGLACKTCASPRGETLPTPM
eukprot:3761070-Amphidinium_carterae.1